MNYSAQQSDRETWHLNLTWTVKDMDLIVKFAAEGETAEEIAIATLNSKRPEVHSTPDQIADLCARNGILLSSKPKTNPTAVVAAVETTYPGPLLQAGSGGSRSKPSNKADGAKMTGRSLAPSDRGGLEPVHCHIDLGQAAKNSPKFRLRNSAGSYLNKRAAGLTDGIGFAWSGNQADVDRLFVERPNLSRFTAEVVE